MQIKIKRVRHNAILPRYATAGAAGMDLHAAIDESIVIPDAGCQDAYVLMHAGVRRGDRLLHRAIVPTGIAIELPPGYEAQVRPRSGLAAKHGITVLNAPGTIDADYRGEIKVILVNLGDEPYIVTPGMRIAQLVVAPVTRVEWNEVDELNATERGCKGFGSTGV